MRYIVFILAVLIVLPFQALRYAVNNLVDATHYWWLDMRGEFASVRSAWRIL